MSMLCRSFLLVILCSLVSCSKDDNCTLAGKLDGEWIWVQSVGGFAGHTLTPENTNSTQKIIIQHDVYNFYMNDTLVFTSPITFKLSEKPLIGTESRDAFVLNNDLEQGYELKNNTLLLFDQCYDCYTHTYTRK